VLWNSYDSLFLYGGEFSDNPVTLPPPYSTWQYDIGSSSWQEYSSPTNSPGTNAEAGTPVQRAAEGAGITVPSIGRGYYFGGHLDGYTTDGWSQSTARVYLTSLLEYTFPGYTNTAIQGSNIAGSGGEYRNITTGGLQDTAGFPERADGVLVYVPGYGKQGIILGLAGGNNESFTQLNTIDVYDIASSTWYKQATSGPTPPIRVNPCAVAASAADGSSVEVYMYGGQNLIPSGSQTQYSDVWILTIPSFTWISVDTSTQSVPPARAGHTCNIWNGQMVVVGGYVGTQLECDSPGIYVFNLSSLSWQSQYIALEGGNVLNNQKAQESDPAALQGSYGYTVPVKVQSVIGGNEQGAATVTSPAQTAAQGPLATGKPVTYTVTNSNGAVTTETAVSGSGGGGSNPTSGSNSNGNGSGGSGSNTGAIIASVIAGCFALSSAYLAFCAWIYRRQLKLYKNHVAMSQRAELAGDKRTVGAGVGLKANNENSSTSNSLRQSDENGSAGGGSGRAGYTRLPLASNNPYLGRTSARSSTEDLLAGQEPSYLGVLLNPRRSLRVVNRD
jgi:Kelch motif